MSVVFDDKSALQRVDVDTAVREIHGLPGRNDLDATLPAILARNSVVSVVFIDLDQFKAVNDRLGHDVGDRCLDQFIELVSPVARGRAKLYRYGGDEFALVMPNFTTEEAAATGERIRRAVENANIGGEVRVTTSIGVASSADFKDAAALLTAADAAMYAAKKVDGPNQIRTAPLSPDIAARAAEERKKSKGR